MSNIDRETLALNQQEPQICKSDSEMKAWARKKQSDFRRKVLKVPYDEKNRFGKYGAFLMPEDADAGLNFCDVYRTEILQAIEERYPKLPGNLHDGMYANMLRSEHVPWNIFIPMKNDLKAAASLFNSLLESKDEVDEVLDIRIEWAPEKELTLNDNTSFDVYVEYLHGNEKGGIGIEVKYTEVGYPFGKKEYIEVMENQQSPYAIMTKECGLYREDIADKLLKDTPLCENNYRQVWRNHLLGATMEKKRLVQRFHSLTLFPRFNNHFLEVLPKYRQLLSDKGNRSFHYTFYETLFLLLRKFYGGTKKTDRWIEYLEKRY